MRGSTADTTSRAARYAVETDSQSVMAATLVLSECWTSVSCHEIGVCGTGVDTRDSFRDQRSDRSGARGPAPRGLRAHSQHDLYAGLTGVAARRHTRLRSRSLGGRSPAVVDNGVEDEPALV